MEPAPSKSESALDIVAEIIPEKRSPTINAGIVAIAKCGSAYFGPWLSIISPSIFFILISANVMIPRSVGMKAYTKFSIAEMIEPCTAAFSSRAA